jgi:hypothetical protein
MARTPPPADPIEEEKRAALLALDVGAIRAWSERHNIGLLPADDALLLRSMHDARRLDPTMPATARAVSRRYPERA